VPRHSKAALINAVIITLSPSTGGKDKTKMTNIINFPAQQIETVFSPALQAVFDLVDNLTNEETDDLFGYLWAMGYGEITPAPTN
jgi:hypothetical protein